jgi:hypothetical protein
MPAKCIIHFTVNSDVECFDGSSSVKKPAVYGLKGPYTCKVRQYELLQPTGTWPQRNRKVPSSQFMLSLNVSIVHLSVLRNRFHCNVLVPSKKQVHNTVIEAERV